ncbi:MAG: RNA polymerase sigma factor [Marinifilaceae bacterium]
MILKNKSEVEYLVYKFVNGDVSAFKYYYELYYHALLLFITKILKDEFLARDILQEVFLELWKTRSSITSQQHMRMYIYQVARHRCINYLKTLKHFDKYAAEYIYVNDEENMNHAIVEEEVHRMVIAEIESLAEEQRRVVLMHLEGKDNIEIARLMNVSVNTVKTHKSRARKKLRLRLGELLVLKMFIGL